MSSTSLRRSASASASVSASSTPSASSTSQLDGPPSSPSLPFPPHPSGDNSTPGSGPCSDPQGCGTPPPATLYLYTFLSTLIILLVVSAGIITRSVVLRRRQQRAIADGTWVPPGRRRENAPGTRRRPVMFHAHVGARNTTLDQAEVEAKEVGWGAMKPFSASDIAPPPLKPPAAVAPLIPATDPPGQRAARAQIQSVVRRYNPFRAPPPPPLPVPPPPPPPLPTPPPPAASEPYSPTQVRVAFLVAMPSPPPPLDQHHQQYLYQQGQQEKDKGGAGDGGGDEEGLQLPHLEFGVLDADVVDPGRRSSWLSAAEGEGETSLKSGQQQILLGPV
ncbi:hypothetical protein C8R46DRAFT_1227369 [Mycena filopes]|nr:hypothetical protein C8R46DRAFT_1227369 [Mycena filopes]